MKLLPALKSSRGFTLIELLVALTILVILAVSVYVALNPAQRLSDAQDARRTADVDTILTAIHQSIVDSKGAMPPNMPGAGAANEAQLGSDGTGCEISNSHCTITAAACANLMLGEQSLSKYLASMPIDPDTTLGTAGKTGYSVVRNTDGIVTVKACHTDATATISVSR